MAAVGTSFAARLSPRRRTSARLGVAACLLATLAGCWSRHPPTYPVEGRVVFPDGSPVRTGAVEFKSRDHGVQARGEIGPDGRFTLSTFRAGDGAVAGIHDCVVVQLVIVEELSGHRPSSLGVVHPRFGSYATSGLNCTIAAEDENRITLTIAPLAMPGAESQGEHDHAHHD